MPTLYEIFVFIIITIGFLFQMIIMVYFSSVVDIKENWPIYRCNPSYWVFSDNISEDFTYCVQNTQVNMMGNLLQPLNYAISSLTQIGGGFADEVNDVRNVFSSVRDFISSIVGNIFGVFLNMIIEFQKIVISIKDIVGKLIGIVVTILYLLDGSLKTMNSAWAGPVGQTVRAIGSTGSCFDPNTQIKLKNGQVYPMKDVPLGAELINGTKVISVMKISNIYNEPFYRIEGGVDGEPIYVTGSHFIYDASVSKWIQVKDYKNAIIKKHMISNTFSCLITTNKTIPIEKHLFWDWDDHQLHNQ